MEGRALSAIVCVFNILLFTVMAGASFAAGETAAAPVVDINMSGMKIQISEDGLNYSGTGGGNVKIDSSGVSIVGDAGGSGAAAGGISYTEDNATMNLTGDGQNINLVADNNTITVEGDLMELNVTGDNNTISVNGSVGVIAIVGDNNEIGSAHLNSSLSIVGDANILSFPDNVSLTVSNVGENNRIGSQK